MCEVGRLYVLEEWSGENGRKHAVSPGLIAELARQIHARVPNCYYIAAESDFEGLTRLYTRFGMEPVFVENYKLGRTTHQSNLLLCRDFPSIFAAVWNKT